MLKGFSGRKGDGDNEKEKKEKKSTDVLAPAPFVPQVEPGQMMLGHYSGRSPFALEADETPIVDPSTWTTTVVEEPAVNNNDSEPRN
jgi:hypothetical protein